MFAALSCGKDSVKIFKKASESFVEKKLFCPFFSSASELASRGRAETFPIYSYSHRSMHFTKVIVNHWIQGIEKLYLFILKFG